MKVGWIPLAAYAGAHAQGRILVCYNNDDLVGFCMWAQKFDEVKIYQIWVREDARMILHGKALIGDLARRRINHRARLVRLWCAQDLSANLFWRALGFTFRGWRHGPKRTSKRRHYLWVIDAQSAIWQSQPRVDTEPAKTLVPTIPSPILLPSTAANGTAWPTHQEAPNPPTISLPQALLPQTDPPAAHSELYAVPRGNRHQPLPQHLRDATDHPFLPRRDLSAPEGMVRVTQHHAPTQLATHQPNDHPVRHDTQDTQCQHTCSSLGQASVRHTPTALISDQRPQTHLLPAP